MSFFQRLFRSSFGFWLDVFFAFLNLAFYVFLPPHSMISFWCAVLMTVFAVMRWKTDSMVIAVEESNKENK